jgi:hypothetical protein
MDMDGGVSNVVTRHVVQHGKSAPLTHLRMRHVQEDILQRRWHEQTQILDHASPSNHIHTTGTRDSIPPYLYEGFHHGGSSFYSTAVLVVVERRHSRESFRLKIHIPQHLQRDEGVVCRV